ncbi:hypothetical protein [Haloplanus halophilus]|uniref:hypothetical protein n=1 Tax=Haloplanus halophilus TaxID=2949993 RepID=UPI00203C7CA5|nr:hypothetical protein [Haloplanus sp. GDY1]
MSDRDGSSVDDLTSGTVDDLAAAYEREEPFDMVEREHTETLPRAFADGEFGRRDAEWVVQWYYRRRAVPDAERRAAEERFLDNDYEAMVDAITGAAAASDRERKLERLTALTGVDVAVASAFLAFTHPEAYVAVGDREWEGLRAAGELAAPSPDPITPADYWQYLDAVTAVADRIDRDPWTVYRALWRLGG